MKILLYEPGTTGHRPVILRYTQKVLDQAGTRWVHEVRDLCRSARSLVEAARQHDCNVIYIMTFESLAFFSWRVSWLAWRHGIRVVCTYYLFNNLREGWKSWILRAILITSNIDTIFISDEGLREGKRNYAKQVLYLPDPWDTDEFPEWNQGAARKRLGLPTDAVIFLMFGELDKRKGADVFLRAISEIRLTNTDAVTVFLLAGKASDGIRQEYGHLVKSLPPGIICELHDQYIPEDLVSCYFYATDYVVNAYPKSFKVSSGGVTRALAAGRPIIVPAHGVNHKLVMNKMLGYSYNSESSSSLAGIMRHADIVRRSHHDVWWKMSADCRAEGLKRTLVEYREWFNTGLKDHAKATNVRTGPI